MDINPGKQFTVVFSQRLDSSNCPAFEEKCMEQLKGIGPETELVMDMDQTEYISSAGLRMILRLRKAFQKCRMINVGPAIFEVLETTGFTSFLQIRRKPMAIPPVEGEPIARGSNGEIYLIQEDVIVKMFTERTSIGEIEEEWENARTAVLLGIPSVICYAVVNDGTRNGIMFERLQTRTMDKLIYEDYEHFDSYADQFADLFHDIHSTRDLKKELASVIERQLSLVERADYLSETEKEELRSFIRAIPDKDTVVHGDFHPRNIGITDGELIAIDMAEIGYGHPVFDFVSTYYDLVFEGIAFPEAAPFFFGLEVPDLKRLWDRTLQRYFGGLTDEEAAWINEMLDQLVGLRSILLPVLHPNKPKEKHEEWIRLGRERLNGHLEELAGKIRLFDEKYLGSNDI